MNDITLSAWRERAEQAEAEVRRINADIKAHANVVLSEENDGLIDENRRLTELLRGTGANRYWEGRWRDTEADFQAVLAILTDYAAINPIAQWKEALAILQRARAKVSELKMDKRC